jgi:hypothetical protein
MSRFLITNRFSHKVHGVWVTDFGFDGVERKRKMRERAVLLVVALACWLGPACSDAQVRARGLGIRPCSRVEVRAELNALPWV